MYPESEKRHLMNFSTVAKILIFLPFFQQTFATGVPYTGKVSVDGINYHGEAVFAFEIMDKEGTVHWRNGDTNSSIAVNINQGRYSVLLGSSNMAQIPPRLFLDVPELYLKVSVDLLDGKGMRHLAPDQRISSSPHALSADVARVADSINGSLPKSVIDTTQSPYLVKSGVIDDQSVGIQSAIEQAKVNGGGLVFLPSGTIYAKNLEIPYSVTLMGQGVDATTLKLPDGANTFILSSSTYAQNKTWANLYGGVENLTFHGNNKNNQFGSLLIIKGYRFLVRRCRFTNSPLHGIVLSGVSADGATNQNGLAENRIINCSFDNNKGAGIFGKDGVTRPNIADQMIIENDFNSNGSLGYYQIDLQRSAGFHIVGNQMYAGKLGDLRAKGAGALIVRGNNFDGSSNEPIDGNVRQVIIEAGGWGTCVVSGNLFHNHANTGENWTMLYINTSVIDSISVTGNVFNSLNFDATPWTVSGSGKDTIVFSGNSVQGNRQGTLIPSETITRSMLSQEVQKELNRTITIDDLAPQLISDLNNSIAVGSITYSELSTQLKSDINRTITKPMLSQQIQNDLNRSFISTIGAFTPAVAFENNGDYSPTYNWQKGSYIKQGPIVYFNLSLSFDNNNYTTTTGKFFILGLPFRVRIGDGSYQHPCMVGPYSNLDCTYNGSITKPTLHAFVVPNQSKIMFRISKGVSGSGWNGVHAGFDTNAVETGQAGIEINLSGFYFTDE